MKTACVIPAFNEEASVGAVASGCLAQGLPVYVVDDGSRDATAERARAAGARVIPFPANRGKGACLAAGARRAADEGFEAVIFLDADGQHDPAEIPRFLAAAEGGAAVVVGCRSFGAAMPLARRLTNRFQARLLSALAGAPLADTQCGFRLVRLDLWPRIEPASGRFAAESEMLVAAARAGAAIAEVPIQTIYLPGRKSRINPALDTLRFFALIARLLRA
ncbi:MAG: glycosyltransferase family 2 protein [Elusimicrobia bacterium]|nr:glycosyltransferase family 2 protein [Elusimicrobiota bacterium]